MTRSKFVALFGAGLVAALLSGCSSFAPVYGDHAGGMAAARFNFAPPSNRHEQLILNRLAVAFPGPATPADPVLRVSAGSSGPGEALSEAYAVARPVNVRVEADVTITQGNLVLFEASRFADTASQSGKLTPVDIASATGAEENAARAVAESLRAAILAGYRPAAVSTPPR
ncbi:MAG: hypothetical protein ABS75_28610 [Pelagibacterium sp. SCN 63-23]|nr:MAG: hypothetical protein ABS75_28610 [Pelagibacterium sp. SCN 63-23]